MAIADDDVTRVRAATDLVALVSEHTALKRVGRRFTGLCPFHAERSPSFSVNAEEGLYYCFGCQAKGDAITFVRATEGCDFVEAVERLAGRAGITLATEDPGERVERGRRQALYAAMASAEAFYHDRLLGHADAGPARQYLRSRGYDSETVRQFRLGFAPAGYDELVRHLRLPGAVLQAAGLAHETARGRLNDSFRDRVMFPILDAGGRPIAFGGRVLPESLRRASGDPGPKYRNSPESPIYAKRRTLYGLSWAKREISARGETVVCEGYTDVIGFATAGVPHAVATCGTALTEDHLRLLSRFAPRVVLAFDADRAGQNAAARLYEWERRHELELAVATLPAGSDPAELARDNPTALAAAVAGARPFLGFQVDRALGAADLRIPEGSARAVDAALGAIAEHPNELVRDRYLSTVADRTGHDLAQLRRLLDDRRRQLDRAPGRAPATVQPRPPRRAAPAGQPDRSASPPFVPSPSEPPPFDDADVDRYDDHPDHHPDHHLEDGPAERPGRPPRAADRRRHGDGPAAGRDALLLAVHEPERVATLLEEVHFADPLQRAVFHALGGASELRQAIALAEAADPHAADLLRRLIASDVPPGLDAEGTVLELTRQAADATLQTMAARARLADQDDDRLAELQRDSAWVAVQLQRLRDPVLVPGLPSEAREAAQSLVAWLAERQRRDSPEQEDR